MTDVPPLSVPFMTVAEARFGWHRPAHERALADNHLVLVEQTQHANFTDFALLTPLLQGTPLLGEIDPARGLRILSAAVLAFFDQRLRGSDRLFFMEDFNVRPSAERG
jgi:hypothetical protein